jgi:hypothetical protein
MSGDGSTPVTGNTVRRMSDAGINGCSVSWSGMTEFSLKQTSVVQRWLTVVVTHCAHGLENIPVNGPTRL